MSKNLLIEKLMFGALLAVYCMAFLILPDMLLALPTLKMSGLTVVGLVVPFILCFIGKVGHHVLTSYEPQWRSCVIVSLPSLFITTWVEFVTKGTSMRFSEVLLPVFLAFAWPFLYFLLTQDRSNRHQSPPQASSRAKNS